MEDAVDTGVLSKTGKMGSQRNNMTSRQQAGVGNGDVRADQ